MFPKFRKSVLLGFIVTYDYSALPNPHSSSLIKIQRPVKDLRRISIAFRPSGFEGGIYSKFRRAAVSSVLRYLCTRVSTYTHRTKRDVSILDWVKISCFKIDILFHIITQFNIQTHRRSNSLPSILLTSYILNMTVP